MLPYAIVCYCIPSYAQQRLHNKYCTTKIAQQRFHDKDCTTKRLKQMTVVAVAIAIATICYCMVLYAIVCYHMQIVCSRMLPYANRMQIIMLSYANLCYRMLLYPIVCITEIAQQILHNTTDIAQKNA